MAATEAVGNVLSLRTHRESLRLSQALLARIAEVSRYKLNQYEQGSCQLTTDEWRLIRDALQIEVRRLHQISLPTDIIADGGQAAR